MQESAWLALTVRERTILQAALASFKGGDATEIASLLAKVRSADGHPAITVGVYGGLVQWVMGNPFPIRICDYDGDQTDLPDIDERDQRCTIGFAPPDI